MRIKYFVILSVIAAFSSCTPLTPSSSDDKDKEIE